MKVNGYEIMEGADLRQANLFKANLFKADLRRANLQGADLRRANLYGADLYGAIVPVAEFDERGHQFCIKADDNEIRFIAGCRNFSYEEAVAHWGAEDYRDRARGDMYLAHVEMYYQWWESRSLTFKGGVFFKETEK